MSGQLIDTFAVAGDTGEVIDRLAPFGAAGMAMPLLWYTLGPDPEWAVGALAAEVLPAVRSEPS